MKKVFVLSCLFLFSLVTMQAHPYSDGDPKTPVEIKAELTKEISQLLKGPDLATNKVKPCKVNVHFTVNSSKEIRVIDIYTNDEYLKSFIEERLDNQKLKTKNVRIRKTYMVPVSFELS